MHEICIFWTKRHIYIRIHGRSPQKLVNFYVILKISIEKILIVKTQYKPNWGCKLILPKPSRGQEFFRGRPPWPPRWRRPCLPIIRVRVFVLATEGPLVYSKSLLKSDFEQWNTFSEWIVSHSQNFYVKFHFEYLKSLMFQRAYPKYQNNN